MKTTCDETRLMKLLFDVFVSYDFHQADLDLRALKMQICLLDKVVLIQFTHSRLVEYMFCLCNCDVERVS